MSNDTKWFLAVVVVLAGPALLRYANNPGAEAGFVAAIDGPQRLPPAAEVVSTFAASLDTHSPLRHCCC